MSQQLENEVALVTGASRGIGKAIADFLAAEGVTVIGTATSQAGADAITARFEAAGQKGAGRVLNVSDASLIGDFDKEVSASFGTISILVNNAGITKDNLMMRMKDDEWDDVVSTNLSSIFHVSKACLRGMVKARKGRIINISSVVAASGNPGQVNYSAAKAGMIGFTKSLAREIGGRGITVNAIAPGFIRSDMTDALPEEQREQLKQQIALGRLGEPEEIAHAVMFLAGPGGAYVTGQTLHVNGGMYMG